MALHETTPPARRALAVNIRNWAFSAKGLDITAPTLLQVLPNIMKGIAAIPMLTWPGRKLVSPGYRVAQAHDVRKGAEISLFVLAALLLSLLLVLATTTGILRAVLRGRSSPLLGGIIIKNRCLTISVRLSRG
jgi:hypothetical protein